MEGNRRRGRLVLIGALAACLLSGCGSKASSVRPSFTVTVLMAGAPNSLDPAVGSTSQAYEADWLVYTPLLTYAHATGVPGSQVNPGLADALPQISDGGRTYSFTLLPDLHYSNGQAVRASDFTWAVMRAIRLGSGPGWRLITRHLAGAAAFALRRARTISGIRTDDATGQITIHLTAPYGGFENVLALPTLAPVPAQTPLRNQASAPPPGVGPYVIADVVPGRSFSLLANPRWRPGSIPGVPRAQVDVEVRITGNARFDAASVLSNRADVFDWADRIPVGLLAHIQAQAGARYSRQAINATNLIFMNVKRKPFSSQLAREAVQTGLDVQAMKRLGMGMLQEGCYLLPPSMYGHPHDQCPRGNIENGGNQALARALVARSGMAGTQVTVWGEAQAPVSGWMAYYTALLDRIGFRARLRLVPVTSYLATIGDLRLHPQTGFADFSAEFPNPLDFYLRLTGRAIRPQGNQNWGEIDDPYLNQQVRILSGVPASNLRAVATYWHGLERYVAGARAYLAVFGYSTAPEFVSDRLDYRRLVFSPVFGLDWTSFRLK